jgi:hypothetical protein
MAFTIQSALGVPATYNGQWHCDDAALRLRLTELTESYPNTPLIPDYDGALFDRIAAMLPGTKLIRRSVRIAYPKGTIF